MAKRNRGYTLAEVATVVGIIGLLLSIGVPTYMKVRRNAKKAEVLANLKAIQDATQAYCSVNKILPVNCISIGSVQLVPSYLSAWPGGSRFDIRDSYSLGSATVIGYQGLYTYSMMCDPDLSEAAMTAAGY